MQMGAVDERSDGAGVLMNETAEPELRPGIQVVSGRVFAESDAANRAEKIVD